MAPNSSLDHAVAFDLLCSDGADPRGERRLIVRAWRALVRPLLSILLRLAMRNSVSTAHSMVRGGGVRGGASAALARARARARALGDSCTCAPQLLARTF